MVQTMDLHHPRMVLRKVWIIALRSPAEDSHNVSFVQCPSEDHFCVLVQRLTNGRQGHRKAHAGGTAYLLGLATCAALIPHFTKKTSCNL